LQSRVFIYQAVNRTEPVTTLPNDFVRHACLLYLVADSSASIVIC